MINICADNKNYYDQVPCPFAILCAQYFGIDVSYLLVLFRKIHNIKIHLRAAYGFSANHYAS